MSTQTAQQKQCESQRLNKPLNYYNNTDCRHRQREVLACCNIVDQHRNTVVSGLGDLSVFFYLP